MSQAAKLIHAGCNFFIKAEITIFWKGEFFTPIINDNNIQLLLLLVLNTLLILLSKSLIIFCVDDFNFLFLELFFYSVLLGILTLNFLWWVWDKFSITKISLNIVYYTYIIHFLSKGDIFGLYLFLIILFMQVLTYYDAKYDFLFIVMNILLLGVLFGFWTYIELSLFSIPEDTSGDFKKKIIATMFTPKDTRSDRVAIWAVVGGLFLQTTSVILNMAARRRIALPNLIVNTISGVSDVGAFIAGSAIIKETYGMLTHKETELPVTQKNLPNFIQKLPNATGSIPLPNATGSIPHYVNGVSVKLVDGINYPEGWVKITIIDFNSKNAGLPGWSMPFNGSWVYLGPRHKYLNKYLSIEEEQSD